MNKHEIAVRTIKVAGHFGDLDLTKEAFANRWMAHTTELRRLSCSTDWQKTVDRMVSKTRVYARMEFESMHAEQSK